MCTERLALALFAHADDETLGAGGTIPVLAAAGWDVRVVILTDGIVTVRGREQDNRACATAACRILGIEEPTFLGFRDQLLDAVPIAELATAVGRLGLEPDLIITHTHTDLNMDHRLTCETAKIAARPISKPVSLLFAEIPNSSYWNGVAFAANYYVDISATLEIKIQAFEQYTEEVRPYPHPWSRDGLTLLAQYRGMQAGLGRAEAFMLIRGYDQKLP